MGHLPRLLLATLSLLLIVGVGYGLYLLGGGTFGREWIKARVVILRADYTIALAGNGRGCDEIGEWSDDTSTCTMTRDLVEGEAIRIAADRIHLDGAGHRMRSPGGSGPAVLVVDADNVTISDLRITGYDEGILLQYSEGSLLTRLKIDSIGGHAIRLMGNARYNRILDNDLGPADWHGVAMWWSDGNVVAGNDIIGTRDAVRLQSSRGNTVAFNRTMGSMIEGIDLHLAEGNTMILNDLVEAIAAPLLDDAPPGANTYDTRWGGNYVLRYDEAAEGCEDEDRDGRCDEPYEFFGLQGEAFLVDPVTTQDSTIYDGGRAWEYTIERVVSLGNPEVLCSGCHDLESGAVEVGPPLHGILGKEVASNPDFEYSDALRELDGPWTAERIDRYIADPEAFAPGTTMTFPGIDDPTVRRDIIQYLSQLD